MSDPWDDDAPLLDRLRWYIKHVDANRRVLDLLAEAAEELATCGEDIE